MTLKQRKANPKEKASTAMSRYVRLRDALDYCKRHGIDIDQFIRPEDIVGQCCTCGKIKAWIRMDAGHWKGRGLGGSSGTYFDERNVHLQCKLCNGFRQGESQRMEQYIIGKYGEGIRDELELKHRLPIDMGDMAMIATEMFYKQRFEELKGE